MNTAKIDQIYDTLLTKSVELSTVCHQQVHLFIHDPYHRHVTHFSSDPQSNVLDLFTTENYRKFISNQDFKILKNDHSELAENSANLNIEKQANVYFSEDMKTSKIGC